MFFVYVQFDLDFIGFTFKNLSPMKVLICSMMLAMNSRYLTVSHDT